MRLGQTWVGCAGRPHESASIQRCAVSKSLTLGTSWRTSTWSYRLAIQQPEYDPYRMTRRWFISATLMILLLRQHNCVGLYSKTGLAWGLLSLGTWYGTCCMLFSMFVVVTPTINQPSMIPLVPSTDLQNLKKKIKKINVSFFWNGQYSLIYVTVSPPDTTAHYLHLTGNYLRLRFYFRISDFWFWNAFFSSPSMTP